MPAVGIDAVVAGIDVGVGVEGDDPPPPDVDPETRLNTLDTKERLNKDVRFSPSPLPLGP